MGAQTDMILPMLREMRAEARRGFEEMRARVETVDDRLNAIEARPCVVEAIIELTPTRPV